jgi:hypothetical protein
MRRAAPIRALFGHSLRIWPAPLPHRQLFTEITSFPEQELALACLTVGFEALNSSSAKGEKRGLDVPDASICGGLPLRYLQMRFLQHYSKWLLAPAALLGDFTNVLDASLAKVFGTLLEALQVEACRCRDGDLGAVGAVCE